MATSNTTACEISIGVSACLLGQEVRFDGGHKRNPYILGQLSQFFKFLPVCPEVAAGLGTPRQPIRLVHRGGNVRAVGTKDASLDATEALEKFARDMAPKLAHLSGYIVKKDSPSCGMERVKVYSEGGVPSPSGVGVYTRALLQALPLLPIEEEGRLMDPLLRENFIERVYVYARWQRLEQLGLTSGRLVDFHTSLKLTVLGRGQVHYQRLGRLVARAGVQDIRSLADAYIRDLMGTLALRTTRRQHANVLQHVLGYLKRSLSSADKVQLSGIVESYRLGHVPLVVPITVLKDYFRRFPNRYIAGQLYLDPHPPELMLRNAV